MPPAVAILNPNAGAGRLRHVWDSVAGALERGLGRVEARFTEGPEHATQITREALGEGVELIVAVGGDGTVNEVVNGFFFGDRPLRPGARLAHVPIGTGRDLGRSLELPSDPTAAAAALSSAVVYDMDVGRARLTAFSGRKIDRYFLNLTSFGMGGAVAARAKRGGLARRGGKIAFLWATLATAARFKGAGVRLVLDDGRLDEELFVMNIAVGNGRFHGGGMRPCPLAKMNDGLFEVTAIGRLSLWRLLLGLPALYSENVYRHPKAERFQARTVYAEPEAGEAVEVEVDGEALGRLPIELTLLPRALPFLLPAASSLARAPSGWVDSGWMEASRPEPAAPSPSDWVESDWIKPAGRETPEDDR